MRLYHLTTAVNGERIREDGVIRRTWPTELSEAWPTRVVWLTSDPRPESQGWKPSDGTSAFGMCFAVELAEEDVQPWSEWKLSRPPENVSGLETSARAWGGNPDSWYIAERDIRQDDWIEVIDLRGEDK